MTRRFELSTAPGGGREGIFAAVRAVLPLDPPVLSSRSWDALADSLWEGLRSLGAERVEIRWPDAIAFAEEYPEEFDTARAVLADVAAALAGPAAGRPVELYTTVAAVSIDDAVVLANKRAMNGPDRAAVADGEPSLLGTLVEGRVIDVFHWGVWLDLGLSCVGFIDALYIDDDHYSVGDVVTGYLSSFDERRKTYWIRPPGQKPVAERFKEKES